MSWFLLILYFILVVAYVCVVSLQDKLQRGGRPFIEKNISNEIKKIFSKEFLAVWVAVLIAVILIYLDSF